MQFECRAASSQACNEGGLLSCVRPESSATDMVASCTTESLRLELCRSLSTNTDALMDILVSFNLN